MIDFTNISFAIKQAQILKEVSFSVPKGNCCALIGHNGAGKTTLIKLLLGMLSPQVGSCTILEQSVSLKKNYQAKKHIGFVPENVQFLPNQTGREFMEFVANIKSVPKSVIEETLASVNILHAQDKKISAYSKGMRQRLGLAQAILGEPQVLLLDEPASGLDPDSRLILYDNLKKHAEKGNTVLFSSHALNDIEPYIDQIVLLNKGEVVINSEINAFLEKSQLPTILTITTKQAHATPPAVFANFAAKQVASNRFQISVAYHDKLKALAHFSGSEEVADINLEKVSLEQVYYEFLNKEDWWKVATIFSYVR